MSMPKNNSQEITHDTTTTAPPPTARVPRSSDHRIQETHACREATSTRCVGTTGEHGTRSSPSSAELLPPLLLGGEGVVPVLVHQRDVARHHRGGAAPDEAERLLLAGGVQVVKEDAPDATRLPPVADVEVPVTPDGGQGVGGRG